MQIYLNLKHYWESVPMEEVKQSFQDWFDRGASEDYETRIRHGFMDQADFTGSAESVAASDENVFLSASLYRLRSSGNDPGVLVRDREDPFCEMIAKFPRASRKGIPMSACYSAGGNAGGNQVAAVEFIDHTTELETADGQTDTTLSQEVEQFLEETRRPQASDRPQPGHWYYRAPCPGVRYYSFQHVQDA